MPPNRHVSCPKELELVDLPALIRSLSKEDPSSSMTGAEVSPGHPASGLVRMPSFGPVPQGLEDGGVRFHEGHFTGPMAMIVGPTPDHRVELGYQLGRGCLRVGLHDFPDLTQECLAILLGGFGEEFTRIFPDMVAQKLNNHQLKLVG